MSSAPRPTVAALDANLAAEVARLRLLLDTQPSCVMRIAHDGTLLAVNNAALSLLGARQLAQVFGTSIVDRIGGEAALLWADFVGRVAGAGSGSMECELADLSGASRVVMMQGIRFPMHPDAVDSVFVTVRDISTARRLELSLQEVTDREQLMATLSDLKAALTTAVDSTLLAQLLVDKGVRR